MSTQLSNINTQAVVAGFTEKELDTLKSTIAKGTTNEQFSLFVQTCAASGLNPFLNQIFCTVYQSEKNGPQMSIQIAVEGIVMLAKKNPLYKGFIAAEVRTNDEFSADYTTGDVVHNVKGMANRGPTIGAYCVAYREGSPNILVIVTADQVEHLKKSNIGAQQKMWQNYFDDMIVKYAIKRAFKRQFGIEISEDEYSASTSSVDNIPAYIPPAERKDITAEVVEGEVAQPPTAPEANQQTPTEEAKLRETMKKHLTALGIKGKENIDAYVKERVKGTMDLAKLKGLIKTMEMEIEELNEPPAADGGDGLASLMEEV
jgi:recombination protein RecT